MNILHVVPSYLPAYRYGGPIVSVHGLCRGLVAAGHHVTVCTTSVDGPDELDVATGQAVDVDGVKVFYFAANQRHKGWSRRLYRSNDMARYLQQEAGKFDLIHLHSVYLWPTWFAAKQAVRYKVPYIISPRGMLVRGLIERKNRWLKTAWLKLFERSNLSNATALHFTSNQEKADAHEVMRQIGLNNKTGFVLENGVDVLQQKTAPIDDIRTDNEVLYLGRISWKKGLELLINAIQQCPEVRLTIAGNDDENYIRKLQKLIDSKGLRSRVTFTGFVDNKQKEQLLRRSTILALCSDNENFGNVVLEAMAYACPVVVTAGVGASAAVKAHDAGVVVDPDANAIATAINRLLQDVSLREQCGLNGQKAVRDSFSWPVIASRMASQYQKLMLGDSVPL
ncbi:MAG: glycosyltransferase [Arenicella sp.]